MQMELNEAGPGYGANVQEVIEEAAIALVREFLSRKGCKNATKALEEEIPRTSKSICSRVDLAQALHIAPLLRKNKASEYPFRTVIEVLAWSLATHKSRKESISQSRRPSTAKGKLYTDEVQDYELEADDHNINPISGLKVSDSLTKIRQMKVNAVDETEDSTENNGRDFTEERKRRDLIRVRIDSTERKRRDSAGERKRRDSAGERKRRDSTEEGKRRESTEERRDSVEERRDSTEERRDSTRERRDSTRERRDSTRERRDSARERKDSTRERRDSTRERRRRSTGERRDSAENRKKRDFAEERTRRDSIGAKKNQDIVIEDIDDCDEAATSKCVKWLAETPYEPLRSTDSSISADKKEVASAKRRLVKPKFKISAKLPGAPLSFETAVKLRGIVFGSSGVRGFTNEWIDQSFAFCEHGEDAVNQLRFGIVQKHGGPCGLLAAVQACFLKHLLFGKVGKNGSEARQADPKLMNASSSVRSSCLAETIAEILWRAGRGRRAVVTFLSTNQCFAPTSGYKEDGITEFVLTNACHSLKDLHSIVYENINQFENCQGAAVLLLYSAILSRGLREIAGDMDDPMNILMGAYSYCTQEMVNLLVVGTAASNTFDDNMALDQGMVLRGITGRADVGLLSLFEHFSSCIVGNNLKTPRFPIWIVCSESHFSVMFCLNRDLVDKEETVLQFDLFYYDGFANMVEEIKLTVDTTKKSPPQRPKDLVSPLEHCIRTKWPHCSIDWNGSEPLL